MLWNSVLQLPKTRRFPNALEYTQANFVIFWRDFFQDILLIAIPVQIMVKKSSRCLQGVIRGKRDPSCSILFVLKNVLN